MKPFCTFCKDFSHWTADCPKIKHISHGNPRATTRDLVTPEHVPRKRRPMFKQPIPNAPTRDLGTPLPAGQDNKPTPPMTTCDRWPDCGCGTQSGPHTCENAPANPPPDLNEATLLEAMVEWRKQQPTKISVTEKPPTPVTENQPIPVTPVTKKGRPKSGNALTPAQKQAAYRARLRAQKSKKGGHPK